jgi:hypothetical protein
MAPPAWLYSVISAGAPKNPRNKCSPGNPALKRSPKVKWGCSSIFLITAGAPENSKKICSQWNPAPGGNPGLKRTRIGNIFWKFFMKTIIKSKINHILKVLNFVSIQWNYLQASPISWDYVPLLKSQHHELFLSLIFSHQWIILRPLLSTTRSLHYFRNRFHSRRTIRLKLGLEAFCWKRSESTHIREYLAKSKAILAILFVIRQKRLSITIWISTFFVILVAPKVQAV